jgi:hypothetical protein
MKILIGYRFSTWFPLSRPPHGSRCPASTRFTLSSAACLAMVLFPPQQKEAMHETILDEIVVSSRNRINPRGVKRKMSNYQLRLGKRQPTRRLDVSKRIKILK